MKVLVIEPDQQDRERLLRVLAEPTAPSEAATALAGAQAWSILSASAVDEAMRLFHSHHPDLILLSTNEVETIGREVCCKVRETEGNRHTGIIFIDSRSADDSTLSVQCLEMGADDFLRKGCSPMELIARVRAVLRLKAMTDELRSANHRLRILSMTDELTGLANMRSFNQRFSEILRGCRKGDASIAVMMMDLDHFKSVNDTTNHLVGSYVIAEAGRLLRQNDIFEERDVAARYGGDEFIAVFHADSAEAARVKAEAVRTMIGNTAFSKDGCVIRITASIGVAWACAGFDGRAEDIIKAADLMLYRSKNAGRNRVSCMVLKYPVDLEHVSRTHLVEEETDGEELDVTKMRRPSAD
jgi:diguanylate cyclase (GGDEF)-like protein